MSCELPFVFFHLVAFAFVCFFKIGTLSRENETESCLWLVR